MKVVLRVALALALLLTGVLMAQTPHSVTLAWAWSQGTQGAAIGFNVYRSGVSGGPYVLMGSTSATVLTYSDTANLVEGSVYYYVVTAKGNGNTESVYSAEAVTNPIPFRAPLPPSKPTTTVN